MNKNACLELCKGKNPPANPLLKALWLDYHENWDQAHLLVDSLNTMDAAWIHAYLHRKEGDPWNAGYWYRKAGKQAATCSLRKEWESLVLEFCDVG